MGTFKTCDYKYRDLNLKRNSTPTQQNWADTLIWYLFNANNINREAAHHSLQWNTFFIFPRLILFYFEQLSFFTSNKFCRQCGGL